MTDTALTAKAEIVIRKPPAEAFRAFVDADAMSRFWFTRRDDGLVQGQPVTWYLGSDADAFAFEVQVLELDPPRRIVIEWPREVGPARITWDFAETDSGDTVLRIEETGFSGEPDDVIAQALDSTGGFNQVIVAAKAWVEHGVALSLIDDHAQRN